MKRLRVCILGQEVFAVEFGTPQEQPAAPAKADKPPEGIGAGQSLGTAERAWSPHHGVAAVGFSK